jgi:GAF domain-containing protein
MLLSFDAASGAFEPSATIPLECADVQQAISSREPVLKAPDQANSGGRFVLPLKRENRVIGVIALGRGDAAPFSADARAMAERMVDRAAISVENARLYAAVRATCASI